VALSAPSVPNIAEPSGERRRAASPAGLRPLLKSLIVLTTITALFTAGASRADVGATMRKGGAVQPAALTGQLLVAGEELRDPRFFHAVIYILHHNPEEGAMGLIVNRPVEEAALSELLEQAGLKATGVKGNIRIHFGGPVEPGLGFILHTADYTTEGTTVIKNGIAVTTRPEILRAIGTGTGPRKSLFALGYAGWAPGQLETEIKAGAWEVVPADDALVFDERAETKWERAMARRTIRL